MAVNAVRAWGRSFECHRRWQHPRNHTGVSVRGIPAHSPLLTVPALIVSPGRKNNPPGSSAKENGRRGGFWACRLMKLDINTLFTVTIYVEVILGLLLLFAWA
jgi:hypothetical protein